MSVAGEPLVARVARAVLGWGGAQRVVVATDHDGIAEAARVAGAEVFVDHRPYACGTDRVAAVASEIPNADRILNVQGDEALVHSAALDAALEALEGADLDTVSVPLDHADQLSDPDTVKVIRNPGKTINFIRLTGEMANAEVHLGLYAFTRRGLARFAAMPPSFRERAEHLEQLRAVEAGWTIGCRTIDGPWASINRPADVAEVERILRLRQQQDNARRKVSAEQRQQILQHKGQPTCPSKPRSFS